MRLGPINLTWNSSWRASSGPASTLKEPASWVERWFGGRTTAAGVHVTEERALQQSAVFACTRIISEGVASLPLKLYRRLPGGGKQPATEHPLYHLLHDEPNDELTAFEFREAAQGHLCLRGNAFAFIDWTRGGRVKQLLLLEPDRMTPERGEDNRVRYRYQDPRMARQSSRRTRSSIFAGFGKDGLRGKNPIELFREAIGLALATEEFGSRLFSNGTNAGIILRHPGELSDKAFKHMRDQLHDRNGGLVNAHKPFITEEGIEVEKLGMTSEDAQFLETRKFQVNDIARIFRVPPHMIADLDRATFSNIEQQAIEL